MKYFTILTGITCLFNCLITAAAAGTATPGISVLPVTENVYSIIAPHYGLPTPQNKGWNSNSHFVVTDDGVLVFDTGSSEAIGREILKAIESVTEQPVRWVINSHSHADHWLGNSVFADAGANILSTSEAVVVMAKEGHDVASLFTQATAGHAVTEKISIPQTFLEPQKVRRFGSTEVEFILSNDGHSPGDVLMWLPQQKVIFGGDVLSSDWLPIMTPRGRLPELIATLELVRGLEPEYVLTGHGSVTSVESLERDIRFLTTAWAAVREGYHSGNSKAAILNQIKANLGPVYQNQYQDFETNIGYLIEMMYRKLKKAE
ncbi:MAG: MBL fold metallo-hydrolase [Aestuariibacter sp.]